MASLTVDSAATKHLTSQYTIHIWFVYGIPQKDISLT